MSEKSLFSGINGSVCELTTRERKWHNKLYSLLIFPDSQRNHKSLQWTKPGRNSVVQTKKVDLPSVPKTMPFSTCPSHIKSQWKSNHFDSDTYLMKTQRYGNAFKTFHNGKKYIYATQPHKYAKAFSTCVCLKKGLSQYNAMKRKHNGINANSLEGLKMLTDVLTREHAVGLRCLRLI